MTKDYTALKKQFLESTKNFEEKLLIAKSNIVRSTIYVTDTQDKLTDEATLDTIRNQIITNKKIANINISLDSISLVVSRYSQKVDNIEEVYAREYINNFSKSGKFNRWSSNGATLVVDNIKGYALKMTTAGRMEAQTDMFEISPSNSFKVAFSLSNPNVNNSGTVYFKVCTYDKNKSLIPSDLIADSIAEVSEAVLFSTKNMNTPYSTFSGYIYGCNTKVDKDVPKGNMTRAMKLRDNVRYISIHLIFNCAEPNGDGNNHTVYIADPFIGDIDNSVVSINKQLTEAFIKLEPDKIMQVVSNTVYTKEEVNNKVTQVTNKVNDVKDNLDNLQIGGRNLALKSDKFDVGSHGQGITPSIESDGSLKVVTILGNENWHTGWFKDLVGINDKLNDGDTFTISFSIKSPDTTNIPDIYIKSGMGYYTMSGKIGREYSTIYYTGVWKSANPVTPHLGWARAVGTYYIKNWKLEKGNKATDWTPAPEDVQASIDGIQVGGRNLVLKSNDETTYSKDDPVVISKANGMLKVVKNTTNTSANLGVWKDVTVEPNTEYTISLKVGHSDIGRLGIGSFLSNHNQWYEYGYYDFTPNSIFKKTFVTKPNESKIRLFLAVKIDKPQNSYFEFINLKCEKGNKATDWTPAPEDVQSQLDDTSKEITTTKNQVSKIETSLGKIESRVESSETKITKLGNASSQNLLYNADFRILNGSYPDGWVVASQSKIKFDSVSTLLDGCSSIYFNVTGEAQDSWLALYSPFVEAKQGEKFTASIYVIIAQADVSSFDRGCGLEIEYFDKDSNRIRTDSTSPDFNIRGWQRLICTGVAPDGTRKVRIRVHPVRNGKFNASKPMLQLGDTVTGWEKGFDVNNVTQRLKTAEQKIEPDAITAVVSRKFYTKENIDQKGYQTQSQVQQTVNGLEVKISESGGYNLLKNGCGKKGVYFWSDNGNGISVNTNDPNYAPYFNARFPNGIAGDWVKLKNNTTYIYSCMLWSQNSYSGSAITPMHFWCSSNKDVGHPQCDIVNFQQRLVANTWNEVYVVIRTKPTGDVWFKPFIYANDATGDFSVTNLMLCEGSILLPYSPNPEEIYDGIISIDKEGITVRNSGADTYTSIDASSFSVNDNQGGTIAEFSQTSLIPNLNCPGTLTAGNIYANNIPTKSTVNDHNYWTTYYVQGNYGNDNNPGTGWGTTLAFRTLDKALSMIPTVVNQNFRIRVGGSVSGVVLRGRFGSGQIELFLEDDCVVNTAIDIVGCTCMVQVYGNYNTKKGTLKQGISINNCTSFDIGWLTFRGANWGTSESCNIFVCNKSMGVIRMNDFNGVTSAVIVNCSSVWFFGNHGSAVTNYIGISPYANIYMMLTGQDTCPDYTGYMYSNVGHANMYHIFEGASFAKTPSVGWNPAYTPTQRTTTWNFTSIWSDETLNGWSNVNELVQGYYSGWNTGRWTGYMQMSDGMAGIRNTINGGTNLSGRIYVQRRTSSGNSTGSKLCLYASDGTLITNSTTINRGQGVWVSLSSSIIQKIQSGAITYFYLRADANNASTYFKCESNAKIEITYTK